MFEKLDGLNWKTLEHAYGSADDAPGQIRNLVSQTPDDRDKALSYFWCKVIHQGTVCSAAPRTIPFLLEIIESPLANNRAELLEIICALASASTCAEYPDNKPSVIEQCRLEVAIGWQNYLRLLASTDECERCSVALALGHCKEHATAIVDALKSHIIGEKSPLVAASILECISKLAGAENARYLTELLKNSNQCVFLPCRSPIPGQAGQ